MPLRHRQGWEVYDLQAGSSIYRDEDDRLDPAIPYHWTLGVEWELFRGAAAGRRRLLDVGCGAGRSSLHLAGAVGELVGVDLSSRMLAIARRKAARAGCKNVRFQRADAQRLEFPDASFDAVFFCGSLSPMARPERALREAFRVLEPGGVVAAIELNWEKVFREDPVGERSFTREDNGEIVVRHSQRTLAPSRAVSREGRLRRDSPRYRKARAEMDARKTRRLRVPDEWDAISPDVKGGSWDSERQFTPAEFRSLLEAAGFASIEHRGYGLLTGLLVSAHLRRKLASFMQDLCRAEAAASGMADISACEMQFVRGRKPGQFVR